MAEAERINVPDSEEGRAPGGARVEDAPTEAGSAAGESGEDGGRQGGDAPAEGRDGAEADKPAQAGAAREEPAADEPAQEESAAGKPGAPAGAGPRRIALLLVVALVVYLLDLGSKMLVVAELEHGPGVDVIGNLLRLDVTRNPGAAFSIGQALTIFLTLIAVVVIVVIARIARKLRSVPWALALGLLLGGALGNLTDRIFRSPGVFRGAVVDFIAPAHYAVFNLADSAIVCGGILIVLLSFRGLDPDGSRHRD